MVVSDIFQTPIDDPCVVTFGHYVLSKMIAETETLNPKTLKPQNPKTLEPV